jgi:hypothetical protein
VIGHVSTVAPRRGALHEPSHGEPRYHGAAEERHRALAGKILDALDQVVDIAPAQGLRHALQPLGNVAGILRNHRLAAVAQIIRCSADRVSHALHPLRCRILLLVRSRAGAITHVVRNAFRLPFQFSAFLLGALVQIVGLFLRRLGAAAGVLGAGPGGAIERISSWACHSCLRLLVRCDVRNGWR